MARNAAPNTRPEGSHLIDWIALDRLASAERAGYFQKALERIDQALSAPEYMGRRLATVEQILMDLGSAENLKV